MNQQNKSDALEILIILAMFLLVLVIYVPVAIWEEETYYEKESRYRMQNLNELVKVIQVELQKKKSEEWIKIFDKAGLPCGPINSITDMHKDNHTLYRKMIIESSNGLKCR